MAVGYIAKAGGDQSIALGQYANANTEKSIALGARAAASGNNSITIGAVSSATMADAVAMGYDANAAGAKSIALGAMSNAGSEAGIAIGYTAKTSDLCTVAVGYRASASKDACIAIGSRTNSSAQSGIAIGISANVSGNYSTALGVAAMTANSNSIQLGSASSLSSITAKVSITVTSDERDKADIEDLDNAMEFLRRVRAFRYKANPRDLYAKEIDPNKSEEEYTEDEKKQVEYQCKYGFVPYDKEAHAAGAKKGSRVRVGVSAQEVQRALVDVYNDIGYANLVNDNLFDLDPDTIPEDVESHLGVSYENFIPFLIQAVQELDRRTSILEGKPA